MSEPPIAIVGGGVAGLLASLMLARRGHACTLYDAAPDIGHGCSRHAGGMLAPLSELDLAEPVLVRLGLDATARWRDILGDDALGDLMDANGSLLVAHRPEWPLLSQLMDRVRSAGLAAHVEAVGVDRINELEPWMSGRLRRGIWISTEGVVHPQRLLSALRQQATAAGVSIRTGVRVTGVSNGYVQVGNAETQAASLVVDCRGLGARPDLPVRGVRGEYIVVRPNSHLPSRPVRLMHPRYPLYIVPRPDGCLYIGATQLESEHDGPVQVRAALELLSALYSLDPGFGDASIEYLGVGLRPAFTDNLPHICVRPGSISLNGLFRHGYLLAPRLCAWVVDVVEQTPLPASARSFCRFVDTDEQFDVASRT